MTRRNHVAIPENLREITTIDAHAECAPEDAGLSREDVAAVWAKVEAQYRGGLHPAISVVLRRHSKLVLKRAIGHARGNAPGQSDSDSGAPRVLATPETPICLFSGSKAITAVLVHKLAESGVIGLDRSVANYLPEFAAGGKGAITVRQVLAHRAGLPLLPAPNPWDGALYAFDSVVRTLCAAKAKKAGAPIYHALTGGFILGEILRRVTARELPELLRVWLAEPLGCQDLTFGLPPARRAAAALNTFTGPTQWTPVHLIVNPMLQAPLPHVCAMSNQERWLSAAIPAGNIYATADDVGRVFQMLLDGGVWQGRRILREDTVAELVRPIDTIRLDRTMMVPVRWSSGLMRGERLPNFFGRHNPQAFGHLGLVSSLCWADPQRDIAVTILTTGKPYLPFGMREQFATTFAINSRCAPSVGS